MAWPKATQIKAWSFSRYSTYRQCPLKLKLSAIDKIQEPKSPPLLRGTDIHKLAEDYVKGLIRTVPKDLKIVAEEIKRLRAIVKKEPAAKVEDTWAFRSDWTQTRWDDWNGCWVRIKLDVAHPEDNVIVVTDWKTGKFRQDNLQEYLEQLELYALGALLTYAGRPGLVVRPRLVYTDFPVIHPAPVDYTPKDLPKLKKTWIARTRPMLNDKVFAPKPNNYCYSCFYGQAGKAKGGPGLCKF